MADKKANIAVSAPAITFLEDELTSAKYTPAEIQRYTQTVRSYSEQLFRKSTLLGELDKVDGYDREITEKHVRTKQQLKWQKL